MNRLAIFVEGYTSLVFADRLVDEIAGKKSVRIEWRQLRGGTTCRRTMRLVRAASHDSGQRYFVLIVDCGGDDAVKSRVVEEYDNLVKAGYQKIVAVRDVRPTFARSDIAKLERGLLFRVKTKPIDVEFILSIMEIEAWFLAEHTHFARVDAQLTMPFIQTNMRFDPSVDDMQLRNEPADDLNKIYTLVAQAYQKHTSARTVEAMDFARVYLELPPRYPYLNKLVSAIETFLS